MRILHTIPGRNWGGMEHRTLEQVRWLAAHGHAVWLASPAEGESFARARAQSLPVVPLSFDPPWRPATLGALRAFVREHGIEVIDTHVTRDAKAAIGCLDLCAVVRSRHVNQPLNSGPIRRLQWRLGADHIITVADVTRRRLVDTGLADPRRATTIGGWADERFFNLDDLEGTRAGLRNALAIARDQVVVLCVGMLRPDKGQNHLLAALALLRDQGLTPVCLLAGSATAESAGYEADLKATAEAALPGQVRFLGYRDDVSALMQAADLVVIPSLTEAQPRVAVQAFATGRPVVASAVGGVPEIVENGATGWLVPPADPAALAQAIAGVLSHPDQTRIIAAHARRRAEEDMRFDARMGQTLATYRVAIAHARARRLPRLRRDAPLLTLPAPDPSSAPAAKAGPATLSALVVVHNEAHQLAACLERLDFADERVVVLDKCTDASRDIALECGARIVEGAWDIEGDRRNTGIAACQGTWVLEVDADERVPPALAQEIRATIAASPFDWHEILVDNYIGERLVRHGWGASYGKAAYPGLFRQGAKTWGRDRVHPGLVWRGVKGPMLVNRLDHYVDRNISDMIRRLDSYSTARARDLRDKGETWGSFANNLRRMVTRFFKCYVRRKGYKEGGYGFIVAVCAALYPMLSHLKARYEKD